MKGEGYMNNIPKVVADRLEELQEQMEALKVLLVKYKTENNTQAFTHYWMQYQRSEKNTEC